MVYFIFVLGIVIIAVLSRKSLLHPRSHGFYRFFSWVILLVLLLLNAKAWFSHPFAWYQCISWVLLILSLFLVIGGIVLLRKIGQEDQHRDEASLFTWEKTSRLVTVGLYRYIRHPLYSSLFFLGWGLYFKSPSWLDVSLALLNSFFLTVTACVEEGENIRYFGVEYENYRKRTRMFIPWIY